MLVVKAPDARPDASDVGSVDVNRDRSRVGCVVHPMDVSRRCESADVADPIVATPDRVKVRVEQFLVFDALDHADDTPCDVVVDTRELSGPPDYGNDRERAVRLHVQGMTLIGVDGTETLLGGEYIRAGQVPPQLLCGQLGRA